MRRGGRLCPPGQRCGGAMWASPPTKGQTDAPYNALKRAPHSAPPLQIPSNRAIPYTTDRKESAMPDFDCLRCGTAMHFVGQHKLQLGKTSWIFGDLPNLMAGALDVSIMACPACGKLEFFTGGVSQPSGNDPGLHQRRCPKCGFAHDFDYPKCPLCGYVYTAGDEL